ncbi:MAG: hypothetical protein U0452_09725 [Anaerolineae bacterium]
MSQYLVDQINATPAIPARLRTVVQAADGGNRLEEVTVEDVNTGEVVTPPAAAMFAFIGAPHSEMVANLVQCNPGRFIYTGPDVRANGGTQRTAAHPRPDAAGNERARCIRGRGCASWRGTPRGVGSGRGGGRCGSGSSISQNGVERRAISVGRP